MIDDFGGFIYHLFAIHRTLKAYIDAAKSTAVLRELNEYEASTVRDAERDYLKAVKTPKALARLEAELSSQGYQCWVKVFIYL
jgi:Zn-dependent M32 family carboxypeptidase